MIWIGLKCRHSPFYRRSSCVSLFSLLPDDLPVVSKISCQPLVFQFLSTLIVNCWVPKEVDPSQVCSVLGGENPSVTRCCLFGTLLNWPGPHPSNFFGQVTLEIFVPIISSSSHEMSRSQNEKLKGTVKAVDPHMECDPWFLSALPPKMLKLYLLLCFCIARRGDACQTFSGFFGTHVQKLWYVKTKGSAILLPLH